MGSPTHATGIAGPTILTSPFVIASHLRIVAKCCTVTWRSDRVVLCGHQLFLAPRFRLCCLGWSSSGFEGMKVWLMEIEMRLPPILDDT
eukprot:419910-Rhodomonas_salina.1